MDNAATALHAAVSKAEVIEQQALARIAEGDIQGGIGLLVGATRVPVEEAVEHLLSLGQIAYLVDTKAALSAYRKVVTLNATEPWIKP